MKKKASLIKIILSAVSPIYFLSCAAQPLPPLAEVEKLEPAPSYQKPAIEIYRVDLNLEKTEKSRNLLHEDKPQALPPSPPPSKDPPQPEVQDLAKIFELEVNIELNHNKEKLLDEYINYVRKYEDASIAARAYGISQEIHSASKALAAARLWHQLDGNSNEAHQAYIKELILQSKYSDAFRLMEESYEKGRKSDFRLIALFSQVEKEMNARELIRSYENYIEKYPQLRQNLGAGLQIANYKLGRFLFYQGELDKALRMFSVILSSSIPGQTRTEAHIFKSRIYYLINKTSADSFYEQTIRENPSNMEILFYYVLYLLNKKDNARAEEVLLRSLSSAKKEKDDQKIFRFALIGQEFNLAGVKEETLNYYQNSLEEQSSALRLGMLAMKNNNPNLADSFFELIKPDFPLWRATQLLRLKIFISIGDFLSGESLLKEIYLQNQEFYFSIAREHALELARQGKKTAAISILDNAEERYHQQQEFFLTRAFIYYEVADLGKMVDEFEKALAEEPNNPTILNSYGYSLADGNLQLAKAKDMIERALDQNPLSAAYTDSLGWVHYRLNNLQRAYELLNWAYLNDGDGEIAAHLGEVLWALGKKERARVIWLSAHQRQPHSAVLRNTMKRFNINWRELNPRIELLFPDF